VLPSPFYDLDGQIAIDMPGARAVFTTSAWGDARDTVDEIGDRLRVRPVRAHQVHGNAVLHVDREPSTTMLEAEADAIITSLPGVAPAVITADCLPIALASPGAVASVHAGWRGLADGVIEAAVERIRDVGGGTTLVAAIGPAAGRCCYEVGGELHECFPGFGAGPNLDLHAIARTQLFDAGVDTVYESGICTICATVPGLFSCRREGEAAGRQALLTWLT
jgi:polyphenol oxidase